MAVGWRGLVLGAGRVVPRGWQGLSPRARQAADKGGDQPVQSVLRRLRVHRQSPRTSRRRRDRADAGDYRRERGRSGLVEVARHR